MGLPVIIFIISSQIVDKWQWFQRNRKNDIYEVELVLIQMKLMPAMVMEARAMQSKHILLIIASAPMEPHSLHYNAFHQIWIKYSKHAQILTKCT